MYTGSSAIKSRAKVNFDTKFSDQLEALRTGWRRSTDCQFICGLPGKEYELWTNVSLRMTVLDAIREAKIISAFTEISQLALGKHIYKAIPNALVRALENLDFTASEIIQNAERAETEFATAGIESNHILVVGVKALNDPMQLFDCVIGAAATDSSIAFLSDIHRVDLDQRAATLTSQTPFGLSHIQDCHIFEASEIFGQAARRY